MRLRNKIAVVTGAGRGIGADISGLFAKEGAVVVLASKTRDELERVDQQIRGQGGRSLIWQVDVRDREAVKDMAVQVYKRFGKIDILVNNAGLPMFGYEIDDPNPKAEECYEDIMNTNLRGYWYCSRFVVPFMKKNGGGSILNISSVRGLDGISNESAYCAAKGGVNMLTRSTSIELAPYGIRVNALSPGAIQVDLGHWVRYRYGDHVHEVYLKKYRDVHLYGMRLNQPLRVIGEPMDVAYAAVYLCSDEAKFVTGANLTVDGGLTAQLAEPSNLDLEALSDYYYRSKDLKDWLMSLE